MNSGEGCESCDEQGREHGGRVLAAVGFMDVISLGDGCCVCGKNRPAILRDEKAVVAGGVEG